VHPQSDRSEQNRQWEKETVVRKGGDSGDNISKGKLNSCHAIHVELNQGSSLYATIKEIGGEKKRPPKDIDPTRRVRPQALKQEERDDPKPYYRRCLLLGERL